MSEKKSSTSKVQQPGSHLLKPTQEFLWFGEMYRCCNKNIAGSILSCPLLQPQLNKDYKSVTALKLLFFLLRDYHNRLSFTVTLKLMSNLWKNSAIFCQLHWREIHRLGKVSRHPPQTPSHFSLVEGPTINVCSW